MGEDTKVAQRNVRREAMDSLKKLKNDKTISEDEFSAGEKEVEKMVADAVAKVDATATAKEKEVMTV